ncbi:MAG: hypothetical protein HYT80_01075, partial [Euryarchaeota archaeon]|nr:hypothetical protein [Euryarchaeota archaeon]
SKDHTDQDDSEIVIWGTDGDEYGDSFRFGGTLMILLGDETQEVYNRTLYVAPQDHTQVISNSIRLIVPVLAPEEVPFAWQHYGYLQATMVKDGRTLEAISTIGHRSIAQ